MTLGEQSETAGWGTACTHDSLDPVELREHLRRAGNPGPVAGESIHQHRVLPCPRPRSRLCHSPVPIPHGFVATVSLRAHVVHILLDLAILEPCPGLPGIATPMQISQDTHALLITVIVEQPARGFGEKKGAKGECEANDGLQRKGQAPRHVPG